VKNATALPAKRGDLQKLSSKLQQQIEWRRNQVLELSSKGHSGTEIAKILQVDRSLVSRDMIFLRQKAQENLKSHMDKIQKSLQENVITASNIDTLKPDITPFSEETSRDSNAPKLPDVEKIRDDIDALHILKVRFAKGEMSKEEYEEMRRLLEQ
jgi:archaellum component FlaC